MDLDLGSNVQVNVKVMGGEYKMRVPTVKEAREFQKKSEDKKADQTEVLLDLLSDLGMPKEVAESLDVVQIRKLSDGLLSVSEKK
jgi:hypothetical protein